MTNHRDVHRQREKVVFEEFLRVAASIASGVRSWCGSTDKAYDIITCGDSGIIKWQLTEWVDPEEIQKSKEHQRLRSALGKVVRDIKLPLAANCYLFLKIRAPRFNSRHAEPFRSEFLELVQEVEARWAEPVPRERYTWPRRDTCIVTQSDLQRWKVLRRYLRNLEFERLTSTSSSEPRISICGLADSFSEEDRILQLICAIEKKMHAYQWRKGDDVRLLVFYDQASVHNPPIYAPLVVNAEKAADNLRGQSVPFKCVYLIFGRSGEAYEIYPELRRCA